MILFPMDSPVGWAVLWSNLLDAVFTASSLVFVAVFNTFSPYLLGRFIALDRYCPWFYGRTCHLYILISNVKLTLCSISNGLPF